MVREVTAWVDLVRGALPQARLAADVLIAAAECDMDSVRRRVPEVEERFIEMGFSAYMVARVFLHQRE